MNVKQEATRPFLWPLAAVGVVVVITMMEPVKSQVNNTNVPLNRFGCSSYNAMNAEYFLSNLNGTLSSLRRQLSTTGVHYAIARTLFNGESVWGLASCREYVSKGDCVACFDSAVAQLKVCGLGSGARVFFDDCGLRYESNNFYADANFRGGMVNCDNRTLTQSAEFSKTTEGLLADLRIATPRTSNFYAASIRPVPGNNATVYAFGQCNLNLSKSACVECLKSRYDSLYACLPAASGRAMDNGCFMRYSGTPFFGKNQTTNIKPLLSDGDSKKTRSIIGGVIGGISFLLLLLGSVLWHHRSKNGSKGQNDISTGSTDLLQGPVAYNYNDLKVATNNFSDQNKLGGGVFGEVYKGTLKEGDAVAVKKTVMASSRRNTHFGKELRILSNVHHRHLMRLLGYCTKGTLLFLVHEYMENGSLDKYLYGDTKRRLNWKQRFEIIFGTARGLAYLHEQYHVTIIHRGIKASNILLDNEFQPKIADFGLIRLLPENKTHLSTKLAGSLDSGYVAPEYAIHGQLSEKVDTYSFGVLVLEIVSGKRHNEVVDDKLVTRSLVDHAWNLYDNGKHLNIIDDTLDPSEYAAEDAMKIIQIALMCTQSPVSTRPAMSEVVTQLSEKLLEERPPIRSTSTDDEVTIDVGSNATASTVQFSGR